MEIRKHYRSCYRVTLDSETFLQVKREGRKWHAEIRRTETGELVRFAGIWNSFTEAVNDATGVV